MATIKDVAKLADVSVATVSRYLNKNGYVSSKSNLAIEKAINELDYKPNQIARSLSTKQLHIIGLIVPDISNPFFPELARAIEDTALKEGYTVILCNSDENAEKELQYIETLQQKYIAGFIIATNQLPVEQYRKLNVPIVLLDRLLEIDLPSVTSENQLGAEMATHYLIERHIKEVAFLSGPKNLKPVQQRLAGFQKATMEKNIKTHIFESPFDFLEAEKITREALTKYPTIDGVFASSDMIAMGVLKAAHKLGIRVPEELQIVGFDGIAIGEIVTPGLTTVAQNIYALGEAATKMLVQQINGETLKQKHITIEPSLIIRETTKE
ncbi:transcriptional regulator [Lysinibacillus sp. 2017]|uniref:LacI family DNA-binding transcriptional regulator n=1 Tax=unclassified Lysinibacillus TaxID=2636778 RepID=UPI000D527FD4|nr:MULTISPECIES: LacI family DNA-binding transcriptional regulator [unclassified Lysinibacillus]AWE07080.1 transcriptional regulator [Lysinibacillus sp. 2017]TGN37000.1 LacI family transcriptional regulator [Lysinibacillus sp. S2017]